ncbi:MAG TPA: ABC transporter substrate-binding protein [Dehalococcoidia bacterium]
MASSYWDRVLYARLSRRRALAATGAAALGGAILSACGGDDEGGGGGVTGVSSALTYKPVDTTKSAKRGGVIKSYLQNFPGNFDLHQFPFGLSVATCPVGSQLTKYKPGRLEDPELGSVGDIAQEWEYSPDKLTLTYKLHPQAKWSPLSPSFHSGAPASIANRTIDADDVLASWEKWKNQVQAFRRSEVVADLPISSPFAPVTSLTKIDARTIQFKLKNPNAALTQAFSNWEAGGFYIYPKEGANGVIDFQKMVIGAGAYYVDKAEPSVGMVLKRNPNYELRDEFKRPFADGVDLPLVQDPAQVQAQIRVGNIWHQGLFALRTEDILNLKKDVPDILLTLSYNDDPEIMYFGISKDSPFKDIRVRQAMSYAWDRDAIITIVHSTDKLEAAGIPTDVRWNAGLPAQETGMPNGLYKGWWLDPKGKDFGENAKYFTLGKTRADDVAEAKRLLSAAGFASGVKFEHYYSPLFPTTPYSMDVLLGVIAEAGFAGTRKSLTPPEAAGYTTDPRGNHGGAIIGIDGGGSHDPGQYITNHYSKWGFFWHGANPNDTGPSADGDPAINDMATKIIGEFDEAKRKQIAYEFQRYVAKYNYRPRYPGGALTVENPGQGTAWGVAWPVLQNQNVWTGESFKGWWVSDWVDESKPPVNKKA